ncbi:MAG: hypothetical protein ACRD2G_08440 [Terriglobia bacterium]
MTASTQQLIKAIRRQRIGFACSITVAVVLIVFSHAPAAPVVCGCILAIAYMVFKAVSRSKKVQD